MKPKVVVADPPWRFNDKLPGNGRGASKHYPDMSLEQIMKYQFEHSWDCVLFLWRVSAMVEEAYEVCRAWDFAPKTEIVWVKTKELPKLQIGMGHYVRGSHESCIMAVKGFPPTVNSHSIPSVFFAPRTKHSEKPDEFFRIVETLYPLDVDRPHLELFARKTRPGWQTIGNEL